MWCLVMLIFKIYNFFHTIVRAMGFFYPESFFYYSTFLKNRVFCAWNRPSFHLLLQKFNIFSGSPLMLIEEEEILESFAKHLDAYKKKSCNIYPFLYKYTFPKTNCCGHAPYTHFLKHHDFFKKHQWTSRKNIELL